MMNKMILTRGTHLNTNLRDTVQIRTKLTGRTMTESIFIVI